MRTLKAIDPVTGQVFTRRTARTYIACLVLTSAHDGKDHAVNWFGRPELAAAGLARSRQFNATGRLAEVQD